MWSAALAAASTEATQNLHEAAPVPRDRGGNSGVVPPAAAPPPQAVRTPGGRATLPLPSSGPVAGGVHPGRGPLHTQLPDMESGSALPGLEEGWGWLLMGMGLPVGVMERSGTGQRWWLHSLVNVLNATESQFGTVSGYVHVNFTSVFRVHRGDGSWRSRKLQAGPGGRRSALAPRLGRARTTQGL